MMSAEATTQPSHEYAVFRPASYYLLLILWEGAGGPRWGSGLVMLIFDGFQNSCVYRRFLLDVVISPRET